jgi:demethylmenaquinone methyltransferase / 2-methoxy-6-polyprenyl-1,4-benzoquinol methylase
MPTVTTPSKNQPAWSDNDLACGADPHANADKARRVEQMFAAIAHAYDLNNRLHSMWRDQAWRRAAVKLAEVKPTDTVLDVACGTGDLSLAFSNGRVRPAKVIGMDFTVAMLDVAQHKRPTPNLTYHAADAMRLPVADKSVDIVSIAFGIRNVADPALAFREFYRVLRPGGRLIVLEFSTPTNPVIRFFDRIYREKVMPITASLIARDRSGAYKYLPKSVSTFIDRSGMIDTMAAAGFTDPIIKPLTFGVAVCYRGVKGGV